MTVHIFRTRMCGGKGSRDYSYDGLVSTKELDRSQHHSFVCRDGGEYVRFDQATEPAEIRSMELGWERYQAWKAHEKQANARLLDLAKSVYPELAPATKWPSLWVSIPALNESHAVRFVEVAA